MSLSREFPLKRFALFEYTTYYPSGGFGDFIGSTDDKNEALERAERSEYDYCDVVDLLTGEHVRAAQ